METLENPVIKDSDLPAEADLIAAAQEYDAAQPAESPEEESAEPESRAPEAEIEGEPAAEEKPNSEIPPEKAGEPKRGPDGKFIKADEQKKPDDKQPDAKTESDFAKAKKEAARKDRSWQALEQEKAQTRQQIEAERQQLAQERAQMQRQMTAPRGAQHSAQEYANASQAFRKQALEALKAGDEPAFNEQNKLADQAMQAAQEVHVWETQTRQEGARKGFEQQWQQAMNATIDAEKDEATKAALIDQSSPLAQQVSALLQNEPIFGILTDGFPKAVHIAKLMVTAGRVSELETKLTKAEAEVAELRRKTGIKGSGPTERSGPKSFDDMTQDEQGAYLEKQAAQMDAMAAA